MVTLKVLCLKNTFCPLTFRGALEKDWCGGQASLVLLECGSLWALSWGLQDCLAQLFSNCFLQKNSFWKAKRGTKWGQVPESQLYFLLRGSWMSMTFYQNNISKVKIIWKITHLVQPFYLREKQMEPQRIE